MARVGLVNGSLYARTVGAVRPLGFALLSLMRSEEAAAGQGPDAEKEDDAGSEEEEVADQAVQGAEVESHSAPPKSARS